MGLYISVHSPGSELAKSPIDEAITFIAAHAVMEKRSGHIPSGPSLDITFMLSGSQDKPPFNGMRMGGYSDESRTLYFEAAVPEKMTHSQEAAQYVALVMHDMIENAGEYFEENGVIFNRKQWRNVVNTISNLESSNLFQ